MKRIVFDARTIGWTGIGRYTRELLDNLQELDEDSEYLVLLLEKDWDSWTPTRPNFKKVLGDIPPYSVQEQLLLPWVIYRLKPDLVHFPSHNVPILYLGNQITTVHDLILVDYKNVRGSKLAYEVKYWAYRLVVRRAIKSSRFVLVPTEHVKKQIVARYHQNPNKVIVTHEAVPRALKERLKSAKPIRKNPFLLYVGNLYPYKNTVRLIEALGIMRQTKPELELVIVGKSDDNFGATLKAEASELGLKNAVFFAGRAPDDDLASYYKTAEVFVYPSLSEGFGLQPLEAMTYETPTAVSRASCLPEICGEASIYFDPLDPKDIAGKVLEIMADKAKQEDLRHKGLERVKLFSWEKMAKDTFELYQKVLKD